MKRSKSAGERIADVLIVLFVSLFSFMCLYPFYYLLIYALSDQNLVARGVSFLPVGFTLDNFKNVIGQNNIAYSAFISIARTVSGSLLTVLCSTFFAFLVAQAELPGRKAIYRLAIASMYLTPGLIPWFVTMSAYGLQNNFLLYIVPSAVVVFFVVLAKTYIEGLPPAMTEAALVDGAGPLRIFWRIIFPLAKPVTATIVIFAAVDQWNMWRDNFYLVNVSNMQTLQLTLLNYLTKAEMISSMSSMAARMGSAQKQLSPTSIRMSISFLVALPVLIVYPAFQKYFVKGILIGAVKG